jgi:HEAT repeat protein
MSAADYPPPLDKLLSLGRPQPWDVWADYASLGMRAEHVPELIRMAADPARLDAESDGPEAWAPLHAWRALGELRAADAVDPLLGLLRRIDEEEDDSVSEDLPGVFALIGEPALEPLKRYLADPSHGEWARACAARGIERIGTASPRLRDAAVAALVEALDRHADQPPALNGFLVSNLLDLRAADRIGAIERAYRSGHVEEDICGSLAEVRAELGLAPKPIRPRPFALDDAIDSVLPRLHRGDNPTGGWSG